MSRGEFAQWFASQPFTTKWLTILSLAIPLLLKFQILSPYWLVWDWYSISHKLQLWRMVTAMFLAKTGVFSGRAADYLYFIILSTLLMNVANYFIGMAVLWESLSMVIVYVWSQHNRNVIVNFMFGFKFPALYLPAVLGLLEFLLAGDFYGPLVGILVGHTFYFLSEVYVQQNPQWRARLRAPRLLYNLIPNYSAAPLPSSQVGFSVQKPEQAFGGRANSSGTTKTTATAMEEKPGFKAFSGKPQKLGS